MADCNLQKVKVAPLQIALGAAPVFMTEPILETLTGRARSSAVGNVGTVVLIGMLPFLSALADRSCIFCSRKPVHLRTHRLLGDVSMLFFCALFF